MDLKDLKKLIEQSEKIVFFGGAGVSTESGLKDFRGKDGLSNEKFKGYTPEEILSNNFFYNHTEDFYEYYRIHFINNQVKPNYAHKYLAKLENEGKNITIVTQNIDGLHQLAGSKNVLELHGSIYRNYSVKTKKQFNGLDHLINSEGVPMYNGEIIRPDVTLYGEPLNTEVINKAINAISQCDLLIVAGTSLTVYPAASFIHYFRGNNIVAINRDPIPIKNYIQGSVGEIFKKIS